jgi:flagellar hook-associated protein 3 FlgL
MEQLMLVSSNQFYQNQIDQMANLQKQQQDLQTQISTGISLNKPSDNLIAFSQASQLMLEQSNLSQYKSNMDTANASLNATSTALNQSGTVLTQIKELIIQGNNGTLNAVDRKNIATQIGTLKDQLVSLANTQDANGDFIFSGTKSKTQPFTTDADGNVSYNGDTNQPTIQISPTLSVPKASTGFDTFVAVHDGSRPAGSSIFDSINTAISDFNNNQPSTNGLSQISGAINQITSMQTVNGSQLAQISTEQDVNQAQSLANQSQLSTLRDADLATLSTQLAQSTTNLQASEATFVKIASESLFNYLK